MVDDEIHFTSGDLQAQEDEDTLEPGCRQLLERMPALVFVLDPQGNVRFVNDAVLEATGYTRKELVGQNWWKTFFPGELVYQANELIQRLQAGDVTRYDLVLRCTSGARPQQISLEVNTIHAYRQDGSLESLTLFGIDVTERKLAEIELLSNLEALRISDEELRMQNEILIEAQKRGMAEHQRYLELFAFAPDGYLVTDMNGIIQEVNRAASRMLQAQINFLIGKPLVVYISESDRANFYRQVYRVKTDQSLVEWETTILSQSGQAIPVALTVGAVHDEQGRPGPLRWMMHDITRRKGIETELAELQSRLMDSVEAERMHLARELHDGPVQDLLAMTYRLESLRLALPEDANLAHIAAIQVSLQGVIQMLRNTAGELRPPTLAPFGLEKAIRSHASSFQSAHNELRLYLDLAPDGQALPERVRLALFRIYQQGLVNVVRHAQANRVDIRFQLDPDEVVLEIQDNGQGFDVPERWITLARQGHLGLVGASERAEAIGGKLHVESRPGEGTLLRVVVPRSAI